MSKLPYIVKTKVFLAPYLKCYYKSELTKSSHMVKTVAIAIDACLREKAFDKSKLMVDCNSLYDSSLKTYIEVTYPPHKSREEQSKSTVFHVKLPRILTKNIIGIITDAFYKEMLLTVNVQMLLGIEKETAMRVFFKRHGICEEKHYSIKSAMRQYDRIKKRYEDENGAIII